MRPLKFRAWNKKLKEWVSPDAVSITLSGVPMAPYKTWMKHNLADLVVSQFTGLHDRHGKEIWEGDKLKSGEGGIGIVSWGDGFWKIYFPAFSTGLSSEYARRLEVIGNIFEGGE